MIPLKYVRCEIRKPRYDPHPEKSTTQNHAWRQGFFIVFQDYDGKEYDYMPTWKQISEILEWQEKIEEINRRLAYQHRKNPRSEQRGPGRPDPDTKPTIRAERWEK